MSRQHRIPQVAILIETSHAFGRGVVDGIAQYVRDHEPWSIQFEERGLEDPPPKWLKNWRGDGVIVRTATSAMARAVRNTGRPIVELFSGNRNLGEIRTDDDRVADMAAEDFVGRGLRAFGFFAFGESPWIRTRRAGFVKSLTARGYGCFQYRPADRRCMALPQWNKKMPARIARWLHGLPKPIGVLCANDGHAMRLLEICRSCGIAVPEQIAVLGIDNDPVICSMTNPSLSSIDVDSRRIGYEAAELLSARMAGRCLERQQRLMPPSHIAIRQSTDILAVADPDVVEAVRFIRQNLHRGLSVSQVVAEVGLSRRTLERRFRKYLGRSLKAEILRLQIDNAKLLLLESALPIKAVGKRCGFSSFKYFGQVFRREIGATPRAFLQAKKIPRQR